MCMFTHVYVCVVRIHVYSNVYMYNSTCMCMIYTLYSVQAVELAAQESPSVLRDFVKCVCQNDPGKVSCSIQV